MELSGKNLEDMSQNKSQPNDTHQINSESSLAFENPCTSSQLDGNEKTPLCERSRQKKYHFKKKNAQINDPKLKTFYKTSIEKWKPVGEMKIHCPRCQTHKRPVVKACKEHLTESSIVSAFFMACFPLYCSSCCFLPPPAFEMLRCSTCDFQFGIYDHKKQQIFPNPYLEQEL
jgi:hypothetical protein